MKNITQYTGVERGQSFCFYDITLSIPIPISCTFMDSVNIQNPDLFQFVCLRMWISCKPMPVESFSFARYAKKE